MTDNTLREKLVDICLENGVQLSLNGSFFAEIEALLQSEIQQERELAMQYMTPQRSLDYRNHLKQLQEGQE